MVNGALGLEFDIPVEIVAPAPVKIVGWKALAMILQLPTGRPDRLALNVHASLARGSASLAQVAWGAGGGDILPAGPPALRARNDMVEGQFPVRSAIDAAKTVAQEQVESGEGRIFIGPDIL